MIRSGVKRLPPFWLAAHEAGHAVARLALDEGRVIGGPTLKQIDLRRDSDVLGEVRQDARVMPHQLQGEIPDNLIDQVRVNARLDIIELMAGPLAEMRALGMSEVDAILCGPEFVRRALSPTRHEGDAHSIKARAVRLSFTSADLTMWWRECCDLIAVEWPGIRRVARVLAECVVMDGEIFEARWHEMRPSPSLRARARQRLRASP